MKKVFSRDELVECVCECYRMKEEYGDGFMCEDFMEDVAPEINRKYIRLHIRARWRFRYIISEIVYDNLELFRAHYENPNDLLIGKQILLLIEKLKEFTQKE